jgi:hypothetical protein
VTPVLYYLNACLCAMTRRSDEFEHGGSGAQRWIRSCVAAMVLFALCVHAFAVTEAELIGADLVSQSVKITGLHDRTLNYFDEQRTLRSAAVDKFVQLRSIGGAETVETTPYPSIILTDGQRFTGEWVGPTPDGTGLRWRHDLIGTLVISLDEIANIRWQAGDRSPAKSGTPTTDTITLINGDTLTGFVSVLSDQGIALLIDGGADPVTIPYTRIALLTLANPLRPQAEPHHRITLADGTRVWADELRWSSGQVSWLIMPPGASSTQIETPITELARIDFGTGGLRLVDLTELPMRVQPAASVFGLPMPVRIEGQLIRAHAPATLVFDLPGGAVRFAATAELDTTDAPEYLSAWSDFQAVVSSGSSEVGRGHVTGTQPVARLNAPLSGRELIIRLEPGVNGPILDRLILRDAVILVQTPLAAPTGATGR